MAKQILKDVTVSVGGVALGTSVKSVEISLKADSKEVSAFGDGWTQRIAGLKDGSIKIDFYQDFGSSSVEQTLFPLLGTLSTVVIVPNSGTVSATNPSYTAVCLVDNLTPVAGAVGDVATQSVTWPTSGTVVKAVA